MAISVKSQMRHRAREIALQIVYELDMRPDTDLDEAILLYPFDDEPEEVTLYATGLVRGVYKNIEAVSELLRDNIIGWRPERMVAVDKAAISIALYEGIISSSVPVAVAISEAVELAKCFGTSDSGRFVNGVLGRIVRRDTSN